MQKLWILNHFDAADYYVTHQTFCGLFSSREKAIAEMERLSKGGHKDGSLADHSLYWFTIDEVVVDEPVVAKPPVTTLVTVLEQAPRTHCVVCAEELSPPHHGDVCHQCARAGWEAA